MIDLRRLLGCKVVYLGGTWDLFHIGHLRLLRQAKAYGKLIIIGVLTDEAAERWKRKPVIPYRQRCEIVSEYVDMIVAQEDVDETYLMKRLKPDVVIHGDDFPPKGQAYLDKIGCKTILLPYCKEQSTTKIINDIKRKN